MLTKRRLTVHPVDGACFSGGGGGALLATYRNGADHPHPTPVPIAENGGTGGGGPTRPTDSRVTAMGFGGAQLADGWLSETGEYVRAIGASSDGVVAVRVGALPPGNRFSPARTTVAASGAGRMEKTVFFSGRHRLSEMCMAAVDEPALGTVGVRGGSGSGSGSGGLSRLERQARFPMLCLRSPQGLHVAVLAHSPDTLTACASYGEHGGSGGPSPSSSFSPPGGHHDTSAWGASTSSSTNINTNTPAIVGDAVSMRNREQQVRFSERRFLCMCGGRPGREEATLLLDDHSIVVYGFRPKSSGGGGGQRHPHSHPRHGSSDGFPAFEAVLTCIFPLAEPPTTAAPVRVAWAGLGTLWIVYEDGTVCAVRLTGTEGTPTPTSQASRGSNSNDRNEEEVEGFNLPALVSCAGGTLTIAFIGRLTDSAAPPALDRLQLQPDPRGSALHYCLALTKGNTDNGAHDGGDGDGGDGDEAALLFYGTVRLPGTSNSNGNSGGVNGGDDSDRSGHHSAAVQIALLQQQRCLLFGECVLGLRHESGRYHLVTQTAPGVGPLCVTTLHRAPPRQPSSLSISVAAHGRAGSGKTVPPQPLSLRIMCDPEERLGEHSRRVEAAISAVNPRRHRNGPSGDHNASPSPSSSLPLRTEADVLAALGELQELKQCVYALLCREQQQQEQHHPYDDDSGSHYVPHGPPRRSFPQRLLQRLASKHTEVSVYLLLARLGCLDEAIEAPLRTALDLPSCRTAAATAQQTMKELIVAEVFPASVETDAVHTALWPSRVTLCVDAILADLGYSSAYSLAQVLAAAAEARGTTHSGLPPVVALLVLYYSYRGFFAYPSRTGGDDANSNDKDNSDGVATTPSSPPPPPPWAEQQRADAIRRGFLAQCNLPATSLNLWAFASCAVDHGVDPAATTAGGGGDNADGNEDHASPINSNNALSPSSSSFVYLLGPPVPHLDAPPLLALLPALVSGLLHAFAMDTAYRLLGTVLAQYASGAELAPALGLKLLFVALQAGATRAVETMFLRSRGTALEPVAARALALAVIRGGSGSGGGDLSPVRGLITVGGPQERTVEAALQGCEDIELRERALLRFFILMQRYAEALRVCDAIASRDGVAGQRVSTVASHLRSLLPFGNASYMCSLDGGGGGGGGNGISSNDNGHHTFALAPVAAAAVGAAVPSSPVVNRAAAAAGGRLAWAGLAPTPLAVSDAEAEAQLRRAVGQPHRSGAGPSGGSNNTNSNRSNSAAASAAMMRPSVILGSLDRPSLALGRSAVSAATTSSSSSSTNNGKMEQMGGSGLPPAHTDRTASFHGGSGAFASADALMNSTTTAAVGYGATGLHHHHHHCRGGGVGGDSILGYGGAAAVASCETVLQRSGKVCGRPRPCQYHGRK